MLRRARSNLGLEGGRRAVSPASAAQNLAGKARNSAGKAAGAGGPAPVPKNKPRASLAQIPPGADGSIWIVTTMLHSAALWHGS